MGPSHTKFLALLAEYKLPLYQSYHALGPVSITYRNQTSVQVGEKKGRGSGMRSECRGAVQAISSHLKVKAYFYSYYMRIVN